MLCEGSKILLVSRTVYDLHAGVQGEHHVPFFSVKGKAAALMQAELTCVNVTVVQPAYFYTTFIERFRPR